MDDIEVQYQPPQDRQLKLNFDDFAAAGAVKESPKGFVVRGGPWEKKSQSKATPVHTTTTNINSNVLDTNNAQDFPAFGLGSGCNDDSTSPVSVNGSLNGSSAWGRKRN